MTKGKPRDERKEQQWRRWIQKWRASGLSGRAFCTRHGLAQPSFYAWRRELQRRDSASTAAPVELFLLPVLEPLVDNRSICW